ncbi:MAG: carboxypeptidase regulatory-like domain-containing protein, partial [bacterium]
DDIYLLCPPGLSQNRNIPPSLQGLDYAINTWAANNTKELHLYLTGEAGTTWLRINSTQTLSATQLDTWLDHLQTDTNAIVTLIYDATSSGDFLPSLIPPEGRKRIVITSTKQDQPAHFLLEGILSFSSFLWGTIINGENLEDAFLYAANAISYTSGTQVPMLDDNGDGKGYTAGSDGIFARSQTIGYGFAVADDVPIIGTIMPEQYLDEDTNALIWVDDVTSTGTIDSVWGIITPPDYRPDTTVTDLPRIELSLTGGGRYEGSYNGFSEKGPYTVTVYAMDPNKNISLPKETRVYQFGNDYSPEEANVISLDQSSPQPHIFNRAGDQDWVKFYGIEDETYEITMHREIDTNAWIPLFDIYESDGVTLVEPPISWPWSKNVTWQCPKTDVYYIKIWNSIPSIYGEETRYDLTVFPPCSSIDGTIKGIILDACSGLPLKGAFISTSIEGRPGGGSAMSLSDGTYEISHPNGYCNIRVEKEGYHPYTFSGLSVKKIDPTVWDIKLEPYALCLLPGVHIISYPVPVNSLQRGIDSYDLLLCLGSPNEVASIHRLDMEPNSPDHMESTFYLFGKPSGARFPITETGEYLIHMKREKVIYYSDLPQ